MDDYSKVLNFLEKNNGCITTKQFENLGVYRSQIQEYIDKKIVVRTSRGIYITPQKNEDKFYSYQVKHKNTIYSYDSALYVLGFINEPSIIDVTTYRGNNPVENKKVKVHWVSKSKVNLGVVLNKTTEGNIVKCYNLEKTICDIIKNGNDYPKEKREKILKWYFNNPEVNLKLLFRYAELMKITSRVNLIKNMYHK